jgi:hypothetical protein
VTVDQPTACPNGHPLDGGDRTCPVCGAPVPDDAPRLHCANGHALDPGQRFCRTCGDRAPEPTPTIDRCVNSHPIEPGLDFCRTCGAARSDGSHVDGVPSVVPPNGPSQPEAPEPSPVLPPPTGSGAPLPPPEVVILSRETDIPAGGPRPAASEVHHRPPPPAAKATTPSGRPAKETRRLSWPWIFVAAAAAFAIALIVGLIAQGADDSRSKSPVLPAGPCSAGARWQQKFAPYAEGTVVVVNAPSEAAVILGGARVGFPNPEEFAAMGYTTYTPVQAKDFDAIGLAPRDGLFFHERVSDAGPGHVYYSAGGAVYEIRDRQLLATARQSPKKAIRIPVHGLDGAPRIPKTGTLLRVKGTKRTWIIDGGARRAVANVCSDARVNILPADSHILDDIPTSKG